MKISNYGIGFLFIWLIWLSYLGFSDSGAFWINIIFVPIFSAIAFKTFSTNNVVLKIFAILMFIGHAIGASFYWLGRDNYLTTGYSAIGNFDFDLENFFLIYVWVILIYASLVWITIKTDKCMQAIHWFGVTFPREKKYPELVCVPRNRSKFMFDIIILMFILLTMVPLSFYMAENRIGIIGLIGDQLPFRLTGIMVYSRLFIAPLLFLLLYAKSSRSWVLVMIILIYAIYAGICSASRTVLLTNMFCVVYFAMIERQKIRAIIALAIGLFGFLLVGGSRDYNYLTTEFLIFDAIDAGISNILSGNITPFVIIGGIANRFYGAQDMILAYQFVREDVWIAAANFFMSGGHANTVVPDLGKDLYGMDLSGKGLGVGIGVVSYLLIIGHSNILVVPFAILFLGFLLSAGNWLLDYFLFKLVLLKFVPFEFANGPLKFVLGGFMAFSIYSSSINIFYKVSLILLVLLAILFFLKRLNMLLK